MDTENLHASLLAPNRVNVDETGHHDEGILHWTWCFDTSDYSLLKIDKSRGCTVLEKILGQDFGGIIGADYWGAYRKTGPNVEPTNNGTERQIRPVVIDRRITQGTRGDAGMRWCERIWTVMATCKKQRRNVFDLVHQSIIAHWNNKMYPSLIR